MTADPYFFGYGSLVNQATHDFTDPRPARLSGWCRAWRHTDLRPLAFLTAISAPGLEIDGMIAHVPGGDWAALDEREYAYERVPVSPAVTHGLTQPIDIAVYSVPVTRHGTPTERLPILLSYLDVVIQGYLHVFGETGADRFFATTRGWDSPVLNDRARPRYPRHQQLTQQQTAFVDDRLAALNVRIAADT